MFFPTSVLLLLNGGAKVASTLAARPGLRPPDVAIAVEAGSLAVTLATELTSPVGLVGLATVPLAVAVETTTTIALAAVATSPAGPTTVASMVAGRLALVANEATSSRTGVASRGLVPTSLGPRRRTGVTASVPVHPVAADDPSTSTTAAVAVAVLAGP